MRHKLILRLAALAFAATLSGCIMYVGPDDGGTRHHHDSTGPVSTEKPADTLPSNPA